MALFYSPPQQLNCPLGSLWWIQGCVCVTSSAALCLCRLIGPRPLCGLQGLRHNWSRETGSVKFRAANHTFLIGERERGRAEGFRIGRIWMPLWFRPSAVTGTWMLRVEESDGNDPGVCLMHNHQRMRMLSHKQRDDEGLNALTFRRAVFVHIEQMIPDS